MKPSAPFSISAVRSTSGFLFWRVGQPCEDPVSAMSARLRTPAPYQPRHDRRARDALASSTVPPKGTAGVKRRFSRECGSRISTLTNKSSADLVREMAVCRGHRAGVVGGPAGNLAPSARPRRRRPRRRRAHDRVAARPSDEVSIAIRSRLVRHYARSFRLLSRPSCGVS